MEWEFIVKVLKEMQPVAGLLAYMIGSVVFVYSTFATKKEIEQIRIEAFAHSDANFEKNHDPIIRIEAALARMEERMWADKLEAEAKSMHREPARSARSSRNH